MSVIVSISSQVVRGHVGNSAAVPGLLAFGHEVWPVPSVVLSNHPGHGATSGVTISAPDLAGILERLDQHGWLGACDAVLTGYFRDTEQVGAAADFVRRLKAQNRGLVYCCDPVLGDDPGGLYVPDAVAEAMREELLPLADLATPNRFELEWLSGTAVGDVASAIVAAVKVGVQDVVVTSVPAHEGRIANVWCTGQTGVVAAVERLDRVPHGIGDLVAALVLARRLAGDPPSAALGLATAVARQVLEASRGRDELDLSKGLAELGSVAAVGTTNVGPTEAASRHWVAGVDGCAAGWLVVLANANNLADARAVVCPKFADVLALAEQPRIIAIDIPIGIPDTTGKGGRLCDNETRARLGERRSSVFSVPSRAALSQHDYASACAVNLDHSEPPRKVSKQCFQLFAKIREVDAAMTSDMQSRVFEAHPELAFWALNGEAPLTLPKKVRNNPAAPGLALRRKLLSRAGFALQLLETTSWRRRDVGPDDVLDACALTWSAARLHRGQAITLPVDPPRDGRGLRMEINA